MSISKYSVNPIDLLGDYSSMPGRGVVGPRTSLLEVLVRAKRHEGGWRLLPMRAASSCSLERSGRIGAVSMGRRRNRGLPACCLWILFLLVTRSSGSCGSEELAVLSKMLASGKCVRYCTICTLRRLGRWPPACRVGRMRCVCAALIHVKRPRHNTRGTRGHHSAF